MHSEWKKKIRSQKYSTYIFKGITRDRRTKLLPVRTTKTTETNMFQKPFHEICATPCHFSKTLKNPWKKTQHQNISSV
jgi:hypothetical protein